MTLFAYTLAGICVACIPAGLAVLAFGLTHLAANAAHVVESRP